MRLIEHIADFDAAGGVLVPTMGALHPGHVSLVRLARAAADRHGPGTPVVVTVFVNPSQFNDPADLERYPRTLETDAAACEAAGADVVLAPSVEDVYPEGDASPWPEVPPVGRGLEADGRPGHFEGVCRVVRRLFDVTHPVAAVFGEKDWQQLQVVRAMSERDGLGVGIIPGPIVREADGLAMSSRNVHLTEEARVRARSISRAIREAGEEPTPAHAEDRLHAVLRTGGVDEIAYAVVRDAETLEPPGPRTIAHRALVTAVVGGVRLLDNGPWPSRVG